MSTAEASRRPWPESSGRCHRVRFSGHDQKAGSELAARNHAQIDEWIAAAQLPRNHWYERRFPDLASTVSRMARDLSTSLDSAVERVNATGRASLVDGFCPGARRQLVSSSTSSPCRCCSAHCSRSTSRCWTLRSIACGERRVLSCRLPGRREMILADGNADTAINKRSTGPYRCASLQ